jgi:putative aldouronate transport system substrate-binding protein
MAAASLALGLPGAFASGSAQSEKAKEINLTWYYPNSEQPDQAKVFEEVNKAIKAKIGATVNFLPIDWGSYDEKMRVKVAASEAYDLAFTANWINNYYQNVNKGAFIPLDELLAKHAPKLLSSIPQKIWAAAKVKGKTYGIINYQISAMTNGFWFREDLTKKYAFDYSKVKALTDLEPYLATIKAKEPGIIPISWHNHPGTMMGFVVASVGFDEIGGRAIPGVIRLSDQSTQVLNQFATPEFKAYIQLARDWYQKGFIRSDALSVRDMLPDVKAGKVALGFEGNYKPGGAVEESNAWGIKVNTIPLGQPILLTSSIISTMHGVSSTSKNPVKAVEFMELMNTDVPLYNMLTYGLEGTHYKKTGADTIETVSGSRYNPGTAWMFASTFNAYKLPGQPADVWEATKKINMEANPSPLLGFSFNPEPVNSELAQCKSVVDEFLPGLENGAVDPSAILPQFLDKLEKAGASRLIAEMQKQIEAWKKIK